MKLFKLFTFCFFTLISFYSTSEECPATVPTIEGILFDQPSDFSSFGDGIYRFNGAKLYGHTVKVNNIQIKTFHDGNSDPTYNGLGAITCYGSSTYPAPAKTCVYQSSSYLTCPPNYEFSTFTGNCSVINASICDVDLPADGFCNDGLPPDLLGYHGCDRPILKYCDDGSPALRTELCLADTTVGGPTPNAPEVGYSPAGSSIINTHIGAFTVGFLGNSIGSVWCPSEYFTYDKCLTQANDLYICPSESILVLGNNIIDTDKYSVHCVHRPVDISNGVVQPSKDEDNSVAVYQLPSMGTFVCDLEYSDYFACLLHAKTIAKCPINSTMQLNDIKPSSENKVSIVCVPIDKLYGDIFSSDSLVPEFEGSGSSFDTTEKINTEFFRRIKESPIILSFSVISEKVHLQPSTCSPITISFDQPFKVHLSTSIHCDLFNDTVLQVISTIFSVVWLFIGFKILASA